MLKIGETPIGPEFQPYVIAEVGINARDDLELAKAHIREASKSGADAVKFQTHMADEEMVRDEMDRIGALDVYETVLANEWSIEDHQELQATCDENNVDFLSTPFSAKGVDLLTKINPPAIKIGSGELTNWEILDKAASTGKPLIISTGMSTTETIDEVNNFLANRTDQFMFLYCVSAYPTQPEDLNLSTINKLSDKFNRPVGFSDHSQGIEASVLALGHDVSAIEKHFTIDRRLPGPDQSVSIEPEELQRFTEFIKYKEKARGISDKLNSQEIEVKKWARHSIATKTDIPRGEPFTRDNLTTKRPGTGIQASRYFDLLGKIATNDIPKNTIIKTDDFQ